LLSDDRVRDRTGTMSRVELGADGRDGPDGASVDPFRSMQEAFARAVAGRPESVCETGYAFAGRHVHLRVVGRELAEYVSQAFAHLECPELARSVPALTIDVWDEAEAGVPRPAISLEDLGPRRLVDDGWLSSSTDGRFIMFERERSLACLDRQTAHLVEWRTSAEGVSLFERAKPFRLPLRLWYADNGVHVVHGGIVSSRGRGALLVGAGGAGKSTTSLACLSGGLDFLGDDYVGIEEQVDGTFVGRSLFSTARLEKNHIERFEVFRNHAEWSRDPREKALLLLGHQFPKQLPPAADIQVLLLPRVVDGIETRVRPASRGQALFGLAPSTIIVALGA
jgi:hypothetical protein